MKRGEGALSLFGYFLRDTTRLGICGQRNPCKFASI